MTKKPMQAVDKPTDWPAIVDLFPAMGKYADQQQKYTDTAPPNNRNEESVGPWLYTIGLPSNYSGLVLSLKQVKNADRYQTWYTVAGTNQIYRGYGGTARLMAPIVPNVMMTYIELFFLENGKLHNVDGPARHLICRTMFYLEQEPNIRLIDKSNDKIPEYYAPHVLNRWYASGVLSKAYYLNGISLTGETFKQFKKTGIMPSKEMMGARLQLFGKVVVGEELVVCGDEATGRIVWIKNGDTLYVLEEIARNTKRFDTLIYHQKEAMGIAETDKTRVVEKRASELEEMFLDTASFMAKSITPSLVR